MKLQLSWKRKTVKYSNGWDLCLPIGKVASVDWNCLTKDYRPVPYIIFFELPIHTAQIRFANEDDAKIYCEQAITEWFEKALEGNK